VIDGTVVEEQEGAVEPGDDQVLVVARIADDRGAVGAARQILEGAAAFDRELDAVIGVVQLLLRDGAGAVDRVEVERRCAEVAGVRGIGGARQPRRRIEGHVVIEELAEEGGPRRLARVVRVVRAQREIDDQRLGPRRQRIGGVEQAAGPAELAQRRLDARAVLRERRQPEDPPEVIATGGRRGGRARPGPRRRDDAPRVERHGARARAHGTEEPPAAEPVLVVRGHGAGRATRRRRSPTTPAAVIANVPRTAAAPTPAEAQSRPELWALTTTRGALMGCGAAGHVGGPAATIRPAAASRASGLRRSLV
jgi:hypothetical protein